MGTEFKCFNDLNYTNRLKQSEVEIILQDIEFAWKTKDIETIKKMWERNCSLKQMIKKINRNGDEIFLLLIHLSRQGEIKKRKGFIWGGIA